MTRFQKISLWSSIVLIIVGVIGGLVWLVYQTPPGNNSKTAVLGSVTTSDWVKGNKEAAVILVEYSDFQCPACADYYPLLKQLNEEFGDKMQFVYRHFPLQKHQNARLAARAAEAAGRQNKFWEMHDLIFENQNSWSEKEKARETFKEYAKNLGLDLLRFEEDLDAKEVEEKIESDYQGGLKVGVNATPTFFLNGQKIPNPRSYEELKNIVNSRLSTN